MKKKDKNSIWEKIINFIKKLFNKENILLIEAAKDNNTTNNNFIEELSKENKILMIQRKYEKEIIKEEDLTSDEKEDLMNLYKKQIETLEVSINIKKKELNKYKENILNAKQKISSIS